MKKKLGYLATSKEIRGADSANAGIKTVGEQLRSDDGHDYVGSIAIHLYRHPFNGGVQVKTQDCLNDNVSAMEANWALQQGSKAIAAQYGHVAPATRQGVLRKEE